MKTSIWKTLIVGAGISIAATVAFADINNNGTVTVTSSQDFVNQASLGNDKEIAEAQLALDKSQNTAVKNYADRIIRDHTRANDRLVTIADRQGLNCPPTNSFAEANWSGLNVENPKGLPAEALMMSFTGTNSDLQGLKYLDSLSGAEFDKAYADCQVRDHQKAIQLYTDASQTLQDQQLKNYANHTLPVLHEHLKMAENLQNQVGANPGATSYPDQNTPTRPSGSGL